MPGVEKRTISLPADQARYIDDLVATGGYASASEVIRAGLRALRERESAIERWLREEVAPVQDRMQANPGSGLDADAVRETLRQHHATRTGRRGGA